MFELFTAIDNVRAQARSKLGNRSIDNVLRQAVPFGSQRFTQKVQVWILRPE